MLKRWLSKVSRRSMLAGVGAACGTVLVGGNAMAEDVASGIKKLQSLGRDDFYNAAGEFQVAKGLDAYCQLLEAIHYPVTETVKKNMWVADFGLGDFPRVGMGGLVWLNRPDFNYFGLDILLLPNQMIPEHKHIATDKAKPKMESWHVRFGEIVTFGEGEPTPAFFDRVPESQRATCKSKHASVLRLHETDDLNRVEAWHFMVAGPEGALVTEYGLFQDPAALRFTNPKGKV